MKILLLPFLLFISFTVSAQHGKVVSAWKFLNDYYSSNDSASLNKAQQAIDLAAADESTKDEAKTWLYRAKIYQAVFEYCYKQNLNDKITDAGQKAMSAYQSCNTDVLITATDAYLKTREIDVKKYYDDEISPHLNECINHITNKGIAEYNLQKMNDALPLFEKAIAVNALAGRTDTLDMSNAAQIADLQKNFTKAKNYYQKLIDLNAGKAETYRRLANACKELKDAKCQAETLKKGREKYPNDNDLLTDEINLYLASNNPNDLTNTINNLKQSLEKNPNDILLNLAIGNVFDRLANPKDSAGNDVAKPKGYNEYFINAEKYYLKAAEIAPNNFDALYYIGALYVNQGSYLLDVAIGFSEDLVYKQKADEADMVFRKSLPYVEKANKINGSDLKLLYALKQLYSRLDMKDKLQQVKEKIFSLQQK